MGKLSRILVGFGVAVLAPAAPAAASSTRPLGMHTASLTQDGQQLVWHVQLDGPYSPGGLEHEGGSLCLLIERVTNGTVAGQVCVIGPARLSREPRLVYSHVTRQGAGRDTVIEATIARKSTSEFTATFLPADVSVSYQPIRWQVMSALRPPACVPPVPYRAGCFTLFPEKPTLARLHTPQLVGCVPSGPSFVFNGSRTRHAVALTFDDGPWPDTLQFLRVLEREHVRATFFQIGEQVSSYGRTVDRQMIADGDILGDHTWNHADVAGDGSFAAGEISRAAAAVRHDTGFQPCLFRAPGGDVTLALIAEARSMGFITIQWDVDPRDWARPGSEAIYRTVVGTVRNGSIIVQHDGGDDRSETLAALPREIDTLRREGYQLVTIPELLGLRLLYR